MTSKRRSGRSSGRDPGRRFGIGSFATCSACPRAPANSSPRRKNWSDSRWVRELAEEQRSDGGWGPFHSRSTLLKQRIPSTEVGVERALALGLDASHPILTEAREYIVAVMRGDLAFPDYHEKNDRWATGMRLFLASTLSLIEPEHPALDEDRELWSEIAKRTFRSGTYDEQDEIDAHAELTGATVKDSYLLIGGRYQLSILGSKAGLLTSETEDALLRWLWERPQGIGYLGIPLSEPPPAKPGPFDRWLASLELVARCFPSRAEFAAPAIEWLWDRRNGEAFWDFGPRPAASSFLPLSDNWRHRKDRAFDWTTRILLLLRRYEAGGAGISLRKEETE